jgi:hypothetical protein
MHQSWSLVVFFVWYGQRLADKSIIRSSSIILHETNGLLTNRVRYLTMKVTYETKTT